MLNSYHWQLATNDKQLVHFFFRKILPILFLLGILTAGWWVQPPQIEAIPLCFFKWLTNVECPGCGLTRSFLALSAGNLVEAFRYNAAGPLIYLLFAAYFFDNVVRLVRGRGVMWPAWFNGLYGGAVAVFLLGQWIYRLTL